MKKVISVLLILAMLMSVVFGAKVTITGNDSGTYTLPGGDRTGLLRFKAQVELEGGEQIEEYGMRFVPFNLSEGGLTHAWAEVKSTDVKGFSSGDSFTADLNNISESFLTTMFIPQAFIKLEGSDGYIYSILNGNQQAKVNTAKNLGEKQELQCDENGNFKILLVADVHGEWSKAKANIELLLKQENPDFVVIHGDTKSPHGAFDQTEFKNMIAPIESRGIKWTITNGNHDPYDAQRWEFFNTFDGFVGENVSSSDPNYDSARPTNFMLPIYKNDGETPVFAVWAMDTGSTTSPNVYNGVTDKQIDWYKAKSAEVEEEYGDLTGLMLLHIPPTEMIDLYYSKIGGGTAEVGEVGDAYQPIYGGIYDTFAGVTDYTTSTGTVVAKTAMNATHPDNNRGVFTAMKKMGNIDISISGHDHANNYIGVYQGIMMGFTGRIVGSGQAVGARVISFNQKDPSGFTTKWIALDENAENQPEIESDGYRPGEVRPATYLAVVKEVSEATNENEEDIYTITPLYND